ncbi:MAG: flagellar hook-basal body complex protein FliE [Rhodobacteraceae bacterium]|nr:MAG: flagellar hook-basal body complex protein FliE [Paracoccaceae bacterium]
MVIFPGFAARSYDLARSAVAPAPAPERAEAAFGGAVGQFASSMQQAEATARNSLVSGADPQALVQALAATELAVETTVAVRDKVVEAYLEILRMPV